MNRKDLSPAAMQRLHELRGWQPAAIERLGLMATDDRVALPIRDERGEIQGWARYQPNPDRRSERLPKMLAAPGAGRHLFPPVETLPENEPVWVVEGEPDAIAGHSIGLAATAIPGTQGWKNEWAERFDDRDVVVCCDCDPEGRGLAQRVADALSERARSVRILDLAPARDDKYDLSDMVIEGSDTPEQVRDVLVAAAQNLPLHLPLADRPPRPRLTVSDWQTALRDHLEGRSTTPAWPIPFPELQEATDGGIRPGEVWVVAGWTSNGKSIVADMIADSVSSAGGRVHLYLTEMTIVQRGLRLLARRTGISMRNLRNPEHLLPHERLRALQAVDQEMRYAASVVNDWTPAQVAADIRATGTNVAIVDLLHGFRYQDERELAGIVDAFCAAATSDVGGRGSAIVLLCQLNRPGSLSNQRRPRPSLANLKHASWIEQRADTVVFSWLEDDDRGVPTTEGEVWIAKNRNGSLGVAEVELDIGRLEFVERSDHSFPSLPQDGYIRDPEDEAA